jgi:uncharacterized protein involved in response to NO
MKAQSTPLSLKQLYVNVSSLAAHRWYFFLGGISVALLFAWWLSRLLNPVGLQDLPLHALLMPLGVFPLFILGFSFTAGPRWLGLDQSDEYFMVHGLSYFIGLVLLLAGSLVGAKPMRSFGFLLMLATWTLVTLRWANLVVKSQVKDKSHAWALLFSMCGGVLSLMLSAAWSFAGEMSWSWARWSSLFLFLLPTFLTVCHRMLPFFSSSVIPNYASWRPMALLCFWLSACTVLAISTAYQITALQSLSACVLSLSFAYTSWRWGLFSCLFNHFNNRLLVMLHLSFAWLSVSFALFSYAIWTNDTSLISSAVHSLVLGFMLSMMVGFVTRVSLGHSGRPLQAGQFVWVAYLAIHGFAVLRVVANLIASPVMLKFSALGLLLTLLCWLVWILPMYANPRVDGKAG